MTRPWCDCFAAETPAAAWPALDFHWDVQDTASDAWRHLCGMPPLNHQGARKGRAVRDSHGARPNRAGFLR